MNPFRRSTQDDRDAAEFLRSVRPADYDATTIKFTGASGTGLPDPGPGTGPLAAGPQPPPVTGRVLDTLNYIRLKVAILEAAGDADRIDASEQGRRDGQQLLSWSPLRQIRDDAVALLRRSTS